MNLVAVLSMLWISSPEALAGEDVARVVAAMGPREPSVSCQDLVASLKDPVSALAEVVETREAPAWLPVRAASCLTTVPHAEDTLRRWVVRDGWAGVADAVLARLDELPRATALDLARAALSGPNRATARTRVLASAVPEISALARP